MEPKTIVIAERCKFYKRNQKEGETIASYIAEIRRLARKCEFKDYLNTALRDQLVCGLYVPCCSPTKDFSRNGVVLGSCHPNGTGV